MGRQWMDTLPHRVPGIYKSPITVLGGPLLLLSVMRWRRPEGRLLLAMSLLPQNMLFYDQLLLWLIPKTRNQIMPVGAFSRLPRRSSGASGCRQGPASST